MACVHISIFWKRSSTYEAWRIDGWEAPARFFFAEPGPRGVNSGVMDVLWLEMLLSSCCWCWCWCHPDNVDLYLLTSPLSPTTKKRIVIQICCPDQKQKAHNGFILFVCCCYVCFFHKKIFQNSWMCHKGPEILNNRLDYSCEKQIQRLLIWLTRDYPCSYCNAFLSFLFLSVLSFKRKLFFYFSCIITLKGMQITFPLPVNHCWFYPGVREGFWICGTCLVPSERAHTK